MGRHLIQGFSKVERLQGKKKVEELFKTGSSFYFRDFLVKYLIVNSSDTPKVLISVPKRTFKRAVDRNLIKRRIREAYRINKHLVLPAGNQHTFYIGFIYISKNIPSFHTIEAQLIACLKRLKAKQSQEK